MHSRKLVGPALLCHLLQDILSQFYEFSSSLLTVTFAFIVWSVSTVLYLL